MYRTTLTVACLAVLGPLSVQAQQWSAEQEEVWQSVEAYASAYAQGDLEVFLSYFHDGFSGWNSSDPTPRTKAFVEKAVGHAMQQREMVWYDLTPLVIALYGDVAVTHYYVTHTTRDRDGVEQTTTSRWTDVLLRQGDRWVMIADHGGNN